MTPNHPPTLSLAASALPQWSTTSVGDDADTRPVELSALGEHVSLCRGAGGRFGRLLSAAQTVHGVVAARFVTTLTVVGVAIGVLLVVF